MPRIDFEYPFEAHGETLTHYNYPERCKVQHLRTQPQRKDENTPPKPTEIIDHIAKIMGIPPSAINQMDAVDFDKVLDWYMPFMTRRGSEG